MLYRVADPTKYNDRLSTRSIDDDERGKLHDGARIVDWITRRKTESRNEFTARRDVDRLLRSSALTAVTKKIKKKEAEEIAIQRSLRLQLCTVPRILVC